jgi:hypothetical protein
VQAKHTLIASSSTNPSPDCGGAHCRDHANPLIWTKTPTIGTLWMPEPQPRRADKPIVTPLSSRRGVQSQRSLKLPIMEMLHDGDIPRRPLIRECHAEPARLFLPSCMVSQSPMSQPAAVRREYEQGFRLLHLQLPLTQPWEKGQAW